VNSADDLMRKAVGAATFKLPAKKVFRFK